MSLRLSKKTANDTGYDGLVKTLRQESPGHLTGFLIHIVPPTLSEIGKKRKVPVPEIALLGHIHIRNNTAKSKKQEVSVGGQVWVLNTRPQPEKVAASLPKSLVAFKRPSENRDTASTSEPPVATTRKRKHSIPSGSVDNAAEDSTPSRRKRLAAAVKSTPSNPHGGQSTAPALPNRKDRLATTEDLPSHPPLEEIEMWVPTPNAKFGPPKRKRTAGEPQDPAQEGRVDIAVPAKTPVPTPIPPPSLPRPLSLTGSQIIALREEEESQSQSQPTSNQPSGTINDSATSGPLPPNVRAKDDTQPTNPNVNNGRGSETGGRGFSSQSNVPDPIKQGLSNPGYRSNPLFLPPQLSSYFPNTSTSANSYSSSKSPHVEKSTQGESVNTEDTYRFKPQIPVFNINPPASAISSSKSPQWLLKPGTSSTKLHSPSRNEPPRTDKGGLAKRRTNEALVRLNELRRAGKRFGNIAAAKGHPTSETSQSSEQPPPHVVFKQVMDDMESPNGSQVTHLESPTNEISASASPGGNHRVDPSKSQEGLVINKSGQDVNMGPPSQTGGTLAAKVLVVRGDVATTPY